MPLELTRLPSKRRGAGRRGSYGHWAEKQRKHGGEEKRPPLQPRMGRRRRKAPGPSRNKELEKHQQKEM